MTENTPIPPDVTRPRRSDAERQLPTGTEPAAGTPFELHTADTLDSPDAARASGHRELGGHAFARSRAGDRVNSPISPIDDTCIRVDVRALGVVSYSCS